MAKNNLKLFEDFDEVKKWEEHWQDMPEFYQEDLTSKRKIIVHFRNEEDVQKFAKLLNQRITPKSPSLWYPEMKPRIRTNKKYIDES
jgi:dTDP-4-amino-4,6-dideoxygalactose transaminase|tara:strand:- start:337 stop:597 length:261 start_codon:yes stop_codon:yes gene_type:complete